MDSSALAAAADAEPPFNLARDALAHWLELGVSRGVEALESRLGTALRVEVESSSGDCGEICSGWTQTLAGDLEGRLEARMAPRAVTRIGSWLAESIGAAPEASSELLLLGWNVILNHVVLALREALDVSLTSSLPRSGHDLRRDAALSKLEIRFRNADDHAIGWLQLHIDESCRERFQHQLQLSLGRYLESFTTWTPG